MAFEAILYLAVLILAAKFFGEIMQRLRQPTILGNVIAGVVVGPSLFALVQPIEEIDLFISIGVFFLFFLIGLEEIDLPGLFRVLRKKIFAGSAIAFLVPFIAASVFGVMVDIELVKVLAIASVIGASSLGVTAKILTDLGKLRSTIGLEIFTITAVVEFIAIVFTSVMIQISATETLPDLGSMIWLFAKMIIFFGIAGAFSVFALPRLMRFIKKHLKAKEIYFGSVIGVILLVAYFAEISGIHGAIGALLLGIAVSRMPREEYFGISRSLHAVGYGIFIPIFFAGIGIHFTFEFIELSLLIIFGFLIIIVGGKFIGSYLAVRFANMRPTATVAYGVMSKGAVDLALMLSLLEVGLLDNAMFSLLVFGTLITMIVAGSNLQHKLAKYVQVKVGTSELGLIPLYFRTALSNYQASQVMTEKFTRISSDMTISDFIERYPDYKSQTYLVFDKNNDLVGAVTGNELEKWHKGMWEQVKIGRLANPRINVVIPEEFLFSIIQKINSQKFDLVPVVAQAEPKKVIGIISTARIMSLLVKEEK